MKRDFCEEYTKKEIKMTKLMYVNFIQRSLHFQEQKERSTPPVSTVSTFNKINPFSSNLYSPVSLSLFVSSRIKIDDKKLIYY